MGFKRVVKGIGKGGLFGPGRAFGIHKLWDTDFGKAKDPHISTGVLATLSHTDSKRVRTAIIRNMVDRIYDIKPDQLNDFDKSLLGELLDLESVHGSAPLPMVAKLISLAIQKTKKVIDEKEKRIADRSSSDFKAAVQHAFDNWCGSGGDPAHSYYSWSQFEEEAAMDLELSGVGCKVVPERSHCEYSEEDITDARSLLAKIPADKHDGVLRELKRINPELESLLRERCTA